MGGGILDDGCWATEDKGAGMESEVASSDGMRK